MSTTSQLAVSLLISAALATPVFGQGQAVSRGSAGTTSSGSSSGGGSSSGSSSGSSGSSGSESRTSSGGGGSERVVMPPLPDRPTGNSQGSGQRTRPAGTSSSGAASSKSGSDARRSGSDARVSGGTSSSSGAAARSSSTPVVGGGAARSSEFFSGSGSRDRDGRPVVGAARYRPVIGDTLPALPIVVPPWNSWYPWYSGWGWNFGYVTYSPYGGHWLWGPYGWYDPWYYGSGYYAPSSAGSYDDSYRERDSRREVGTIRLRVNPESAQVFIDGALVGTVDEFNGLKNHLELEGGTHKIELRADGYETYTGEITVAVGKTLTERIRLKKK
jgi:hypothetical protein